MTVPGFAFPFSVDGVGRSAAPADADAHVRQMIEQLLFTSRGERVNRPELGSDLAQLVFASNSPELASALQFTLQASLQQFLGDVIELRGLEVRSEDASLRVSLQYALRSTGAVTTLEFDGGAPATP